MLTEPHSRGKLAPEHLHAMVVLVSDVHQAARDSHTLGVAELPIRRSFVAPLAHERAIRSAEHLHAMVVLVSDVHQAARHSHTTGVAELPICRSFAAPLAHKFACTMLQRRIQKFFQLAHGIAGGGWQSCSSICWTRVKRSRATTASVLVMVVRASSSSTLS